MIESPLSIAVVFRLGPVPITTPVLVTWGIMALLGVITSVLGGIVLFFVHVGRRSAAHNETPEVESQTTNN